VSAWDGTPVEAQQGVSVKELSLPVELMFGLKFTAVDEQGIAVQTSEDLVYGGRRVGLSKGLISKSSSQLPRAFFPDLDDSRIGASHRDVPIVATAHAQLEEAPTASISFQLPGHYRDTHHVDLDAIVGAEPGALPIRELTVFRETELGSVNLVISDALQRLPRSGVASRPNIFFVGFEQQSPGKKFFRWDPARIATGEHLVSGLPIGEYLVGITQGLDSLQSNSMSSGPVKLIVTGEQTSKVELALDELRIVQVETPQAWPTSAGDALYLSAKIPGVDWGGTFLFAEPPIAIVAPSRDFSLRLKLRTLNAILFDWTEVPEKTRLFTWQ